MFIKRMFGEQLEETVRDTSLGLYSAKYERSQAAYRLVCTGIFVSLMFAILVVWALFIKELTKVDIVSSVACVVLGIACIVRDVLRLKKRDDRVWRIREELAKANGTMFYGKPLVDK